MCNMMKGYHAATKCSHCINLFAQESAADRCCCWSSANIILLNTPDKAYFSHAADDTTGAHLSKQQTWAQELALPDSCTKSTSNRPHQTPASCSDCDHKTTITQKQMRELLSPKQPRSHKFVQRTYTHTHTPNWVSKYHCAGLVNSQVHTLRTEPDTWQTGETGRHITRLHIAVTSRSNGAPHAVYIQQNTVFSSCLFF